MPAQPPVDSQRVKKTDQENIGMYTGMYIATFFFLMDPRSLNLLRISGNDLNQFEPNISHLARVDDFTGLSFHDAVMNFIRWGHFGNCIAHTFQRCINL